jgi:starvation-inducible DNA-binding protein
MKTKLKAPTTTKQAMVVQLPTKSPLVEPLNQVLAYVIDLKLQAKQAHWNVKGKNFIAIHELFDQVASETDGYADLLAERVMQLNGMAQGTLQAVSKASELQPYPTHMEDSQQHIAALATAMHTVERQVNGLIDIATVKNDAVTADICTEIARGLSKLHWFVVSHLPG